MTTFEYYVVGLLLAILCVVFVALQEIIKRLGLNKEILKTNNKLVNDFVYSSELLRKVGKLGSWVWNRYKFSIK